jgi:hypothetical protein
MVRLPTVEQGEFATLHPDPALLSRFSSVVPWRSAEASSQAAAQLSPAERQMLCLSLGQAFPERLGYALAMVVSQRLRGRRGLRGLR